MRIRTKIKENKEEKELIIDYKNKVFTVQLEGYEIFDFKLVKKN